MPRPDRFEDAIPDGSPGAERAERLARLRAARPAGPGGSETASLAPEAARTDLAPATPPGRTRAPDPFSGPGPAAGFAEAPRGFAGAERPPILNRIPLPKPTPVPAPTAFRVPPERGEEDRPPREGQAEAEDGLDRLPGIGPGLLWALGRAGIGGLADLAALEPEALAARLGPIGRLVPARAWIAAARAARRDWALCRDHP